MSEQIKLKEIDGLWYGVLVDPDPTEEDVVMTDGHLHKTLTAIYAKQVATKYKVVFDIEIQELIDKNERRLQATYERERESEEYDYWDKVLTSIN